MTWRGKPFQASCKIFVDRALRGTSFLASELPLAIYDGDISTPGAVTGTMLKAGIVECIGYEPSRNPKAHGRRCAKLRLKSRSAAITWLRANGFDAPKENQYDCLPLFAKLGL
jgi:hypothetical protein